MYDMIIINQPQTKQTEQTQQTLQRDSYLEVMIRGASKLQSTLNNQDLTVICSPIPSLR